jgi:CubicO group peptidase (beta-lactamase class C family)
VLLTLLMLLLASPAPARGEDSSPGPPPIAALIDSFERDLGRLLRRDRVPGAAAAILHRGEVVWEGSAGVADRRTGAPVDRDTVFQVASLSKPVTALGVLILVEEGTLDLDRPVWDYISSWRLPASAYDASSVTARRLLSHRAAIGVHGYPGIAPDRTLPSLLGSLEGQTGGAGRVELVAAPGSTVRYSSGGYTILQLLIEEVTGEPFAAFMQRRVLEPLQMTQSSFEVGAGTEAGPYGKPARDGDLAGPLATGHGWWGNRLPGYRFREQAASGLLSTAGDLARFLAVLHSPEAQARVGVSRATIETMLRPPPGAGFALGFAIEPAPAGAFTGRTGGGGVVSHPGSNRGYRAIFGAAPDRGDGFVVLTNSDRGLAMTSDLFCSWGRWVTDLELASCWAERKRRGTLVAVAGMVGLGLLMDGVAFTRRQWRRRRPAAGPSRAPLERHGWASWVRLLLSIAILAGWWVFWYSGQFAFRREGISNYVPASSLPPTVFGLTVVLTGWCLLGVARWLAAIRPRRGAG